MFSRNPKLAEFPWSSVSVWRSAHFTEMIEWWTALFSEDGAEALSRHPGISLDTQVGHGVCVGGRHPGVTDLEPNA